MIRSGEHALWEAYMVRGRVLADRTIQVRFRFDAAKFERELLAFGRAVSQAVERASQQMAALGSAYAASQQRARNTPGAHR